MLDDRRESFNDYVTDVADIFGIREQEVFRKTKESVVADARHVLYYLCKLQGLKVTYIQRYMSDNGYDCPHSSIIYGIQKIKRKIDEGDTAFTKIVFRIRKSNNQKSEANG